MKTVIEMAREADKPDETCWLAYEIDFLERFAELARADEREACAKLCDDEARMHDHLDHNGRSRHIDDAAVASTCGAAIRAQGNK